ncbi:hypothetical protein ACOSQ2_005188 [Xanthoceras sorbifolium]
MSVCKISLALFCLVMGLAHAQDSPQDYLDAHNAARSQVGVGPVTWDDQVAAYAQNYANQRISDCSLVHSDGSYGENNLFFRETEFITIYSKFSCTGTIGVHNSRIWLIKVN